MVCAESARLWNALRGICSKIGAVMRTIKQFLAALVCIAIGVPISAATGLIAKVAVPLLGVFAYWYWRIEKQHAHEVQPAMRQHASGEWSHNPYYGMDTPGNDYAALGIMAFIGFFVIVVMFPIFPSVSTFSAVDVLNGVSPESSKSAPAALSRGGRLALPDGVYSPYRSYHVTQGNHRGLAVDIAGNKGTPILAMFDGYVSSNYIDGYGNSTLIIMGDNGWTSTMLHGNYTAGQGTLVQAGQQVGTESNIGNTYDRQGNSCRGRDCGYHTHLTLTDAYGLDFNMCSGGACEG